MASHHGHLQGDREEGTGERRDMDRASSGEPCLQGNPGLGLSVPEQVLSPPVREPN